MRHFTIKITQGGRSVRYSAIARTSGQALADAFRLVSAATPFSIMVSGSAVPHG